MSPPISADHQLACKASSSCGLLSVPGCTLAQLPAGNWADSAAQAESVTTGRCSHHSWAANMTKALCLTELCGDFVALESDQYNSSLDHIIHCQYLCSSILCLYSPMSIIECVGFCIWRELPHVSIWLEHHYWIIACSCNTRTFDVTHCLLIAASDINLASYVAGSSASIVKERL